MADRPIIFSGPMVRALLDGRKTQTRRLFKVPAGSYVEQGRVWAMTDGCAYGDAALPYAPGDRLYVREAFNAFQFSQDGDEAWPVKIPTLEECKEAEALAHRYGAPQIVYRESDRAREWFADQQWRPSIHMPRWASRITLTVTEVRVQRLQDISEADAVDEGAMFHDGRPVGHHGWRHDFKDVFPTARDSLVALWNSLHGAEAWDANPWVVAVSFTVDRRNIDSI